MRKENDIGLPVDVISQQYLDFGEENDVEIAGIIKTYPHADFVSSYLEFHRLTGATIYVSNLVDATYSHTIQNFLFCSFRKSDCCSIVSTQ